MNVCLLQSDDMANSFVQTCLVLPQAAFWEAADSGPDGQALMLDLDLDAWLSGPFVDLL